MCAEHISNFKLKICLNKTRNGTPTSDIPTENLNRKRTYFIPGNTTSLFSIMFMLKILTSGASFSRETCPFPSPNPQIARRAHDFFPIHLFTSTTEFEYGMHTTKQIILCVAFVWVELSWILYWIRPNKIFGHKAESWKPSRLVDLKLSIALDGHGK